jgi:hypothetical protein
MKKILIWTLAIIAAVVVAIWGYLGYRKSKSHEGLVHVQSLAVVEVSVDRILFSIAKNAMSNLGVYTKRRTDTIDREKLDITESGWNIPANVYLFSLKDTPSRLFSVQSIADSKRFSSFIKQQLFISADTLIDGQALHYGASKDGRLILLFDDKRFVLSVGTDQKQDMSVMASLILDEGKKLVSVSSLSLNSLQTAESDITYLNREDQTRVAVNFFNGKIDIKGSIQSSLLVGAKEPLVRPLDTSSIMYGWLNADLRPLFKKNAVQLSDHQISVDSLSKYYGGYIDVQWKAGQVKQVDTIVTYDLDDNFEMAEKMERREVEVPNVGVVVKASPHLASYLPEKLFYKFSKNSKGDLIAFNTGPQTTIDDKRVTSPYYFFLRLKFDSAFPIFAPKTQEMSWKKLQVFEISASRAEHDLSEINASCTLVDKDIHALYQLL